MLSSALSLLVLVAAGLAKPTPPALKFLYSLNITEAARIDIGTTPLGERGVLPIAGGTFTGPKLSGKIVTGLDWGLTDARGTFNPEVIYVLETHDGAGILVSERGHAPNLFSTFETGSDKYDWLNSVVAYGTGGPTAGGVLLDLWQVGAYEDE